jgi:hypothetical protein
VSTHTMHRCPNCGGPLPPPSATRTTRCTYCSVLLAPLGGAWKAAPADAPEEPLRDPHLPRFWLGGRRYAVLGRLARGDGGDVFLARRDSRLTEQVLVKVAKDDAGAARLEREQAVLDRLETSTVQGAAHFTRLLPQRAGYGIARLGMTGRDGERRVALMRWRSGFVHTWEDVRAAYPAGVAPEACVWLWKRVLELLGWVHRCGIEHADVTLSHLVVHARDHGVVIVGWAGARPGSGAADLAASARAVLAVLKDASRAPTPLARLLEDHARLAPGVATDAWALKDELDAIAREVFGPPRFVPFAMPGWT